MKYVKKRHFFMHQIDQMNKEQASIILVNFVKQNLDFKEKHYKTYSRNARVLFSKKRLSSDRKHVSNKFESKFSLKLRSHQG